MRVRDFSAAENRNPGRAGYTGKGDVWDPLKGTQAPSAFVWGEESMLSNRCGYARLFFGLRAWDR